VGRPETGLVRLDDAAEPVGLVVGLRLQEAVAPAPDRQPAHAEVPFRKPVHGDEAVRQRPGKPVPPLGLAHPREGRPRKGVEGSSAPAGRLRAAPEALPCQPVPAMLRRALRAARAAAADHPRPRAERDLRRRRTLDPVEVLAQRDMLVRCQLALHPDKEPPETRALHAQSPCAASGTLAIMQEQNVNP
jgi:hypothetical protein